MWIWDTEFSLLILFYGLPPWPFSINILGSYWLVWNIYKRLKSNIYRFVFIPHFITPPTLTPTPQADHLTTSQMLLCTEVCSQAHHGFQHLRLQIQWLDECVRERARARGPASLFVRRVVDQRPVQAAGVRLLLVQHCPVPYQVAEGVVHGGSEAQSGHEPRGGVGRHERQSPAVRGVRQPQRVQAQVGAQRVGAGVRAEVRRVGLQRGEGGAVTQGHGSGEHRPRGRGCGCGGRRELLRALEHPLRRPRLLRPGLRRLRAAVVEDLLDGLHHVLAAALQHELQHAPLVAREDPGQDVDGVHVAGGHGGRGRLLLVLVDLRTGVWTEGADGSRGLLSVLQRFGHRGVDERLAVSVLRTGAPFVPSVRGGDARGRVALRGGRLPSGLLRGGWCGQLALGEQLVLLDARLCSKTHEIISRTFALPLQNPELFPCAFSRVCRTAHLSCSRCWRNRTPRSWVWVGWCRWRRPAPAPPPCRTAAAARGPRSPPAPAAAAAPPARPLRAAALRSACTLRTCSPSSGSSACGL